MSGGGFNDKSPKEQLSSHSCPALQEPGKNCQSLRSSGSPQEETGTIYISCLRDCRMMINFCLMFMFMSVSFLISGDIKAPTGHEEEEAGDVKDTN